MYWGCNYWASHAGTEMWKQWRPEIVEQDFRLMHDFGCNMVRVFPNWRDFQPLEALYSTPSEPRLISFRAKLKPETPCERDGVDPEMLQRFRFLSDVAEHYHIKLIVGILTGWMSGSDFIPPALQGRNLIKDPVARKWELRFIRRFVQELKDCPAILFWEPGNECTGLGPATSSAEAWEWNASIVNAIKAADPQRPVASGLHGLQPGDENLPYSDIIWTIQDQGELCDLVTAHPYPHSPSKQAARVDAHNSIRAVFQATFEMLYYADIAGKPGCVEEIGTFAPSFCAEKEKADFVRNSMLNSWAHGSENFLWWCAFDQSEFDYPPYEWSSWERALGLFTAQKHPKLCAEAFKQTGDFLKNAPVQQLPPFRRDAVCVLTRYQDYNASLSNAWSTLLLAKQNNFDLKFNFCTNDLPDSKLYLVPGLVSGSGLYRSEYQALLQKVEQGATLYISLYDGALEPFETIFGVEVATREARTVPAKINYQGASYEIPGPYKLNLRNLEAEVLAQETDGNPVFIRHQYGRGWVYLLTLPLELALGKIPGAFHRANAPQWRNFYQDLAQEVVAQRRLITSHPQLTVTEHEITDKSLWAVVINNSPVDLPADFKYATNWQVIGEKPRQVPAHGAVILQLNADN